jgi:hypothetical protein
MFAESLVLSAVQEDYTSYPKKGEEVQEDSSQIQQGWPNQSVVSLVWLKDFQTAVTPEF